MAKVRLPTPHSAYDPAQERRRIATIEQELEARWTRFEDLEVAPKTEASDPIVYGTRIILTSPDGTRYELTVDDAGVLGTNPV